MEFFLRGHSIEDLRPLLSHDDLLVRREAVGILSELGVAATPLLSEIDALLAEEDRVVRYNVLQVLVVCARGEHADKCIMLFECLESDDGAIRRLAMRLVPNVDISQLDAALEHFLKQRGRGTVHATFIPKVAFPSPVSASYAEGLLGDPDPLSRAYGLVLAVLKWESHAELLEAASRCDDQDVEQAALLVQRRLVRRSRTLAARRAGK